MVKHRLLLAALFPQTPTNFPELLSSVEHMELMNEYMTNAGGAAPFTQATIDLYKTTPANNMTVFNTDWKDLIFQNSGLMQNHNLVISGGSDKASFFPASGTYLNQQGLVSNNMFKKYDLRINGDVNITRKIKFTTDLFYTKSSNLQPGGMAPVEIIKEVSTAGFSREIWRLNNMVTIKLIQQN